MTVKLLLYYMNGCGWCDKFMPTWNKLKEKYSTEEYESNDINNSPDAEKILSKFGDDALNGFPSLFIVINNIHHRYNGDRSMNDIENFIASNGNIKKDNKENKDNNDKVVFYYFYMDGCGWCEKFKPIWNKLKNNKEYDFYDYERNEMSELPIVDEIEKELDIKIKTYPAIFIKIDNTFYKYEGERKEETILDFVNKVMNKNKYIQSGGQIDYRNKYKKYKTMYAKLLKKYNKLKSE